MKRKAASSQARRARQTGSDRSTRRPLVPDSPKEGTRVRRTRTEMPFDAEDLALASLEVRVRAEESRVDLDSEQVVATLTICLPRPLFLRLRSRAAQHNIAPSRLIELALNRYLPSDKARRRGR